MADSAASETAFDVESFIYEYYDAWSGTDLDRIMSYYTDDVVLQIPGSLMEGKEAVRNQFAGPFTTAFPGNRHLVKKMIFGPGVVTVEFSFEAEHTGPFAGYAATGARISLPGCGVYEYDPARRQITAGRIYFDVGTLLQTITDELVDDRQKSEVSLRTNERYAASDIEDRKRAEDTLLRQAGVRADVSAAFSKPIELGEILRGCAEAIVRHLDAAFARIWTLSKDETTLELQASAGMYTRLDGSYSRVPVGDLKVGLIAQKKQAHFTNDVLNDPRVHDKDWAKDNGMVAFAGYPLVVEDRLIGVLALFARSPLPESILDTLASVADTIAQGIERKRAEEALRTSERNLSLTIETIPTLIQVSRPDGTVLSVNQAVLDYYGVTLQEMQRDDFRARVYHPDDVKRLREEREEALKCPRQFEYEQRALGKDGKYRWFLVRYNPLLDEQGRIDRWYAIAFDIEDRKRAEDERARAQEALRNALDEIQKSESRLQQVVDAIPTLAWCALPDGQIEFVNKAWHEYTGLSAEESRGWTWQHAFHPDDLPLLMDKWTQMLASGEADEIEARLGRHDGVYRWFLIRAQPFRDESGTIARWYGTSTDIHDRKKAEEALRTSERNLAAIVNTIPTAAWTARPDGYCDFLNQVWLDYAGMIAEKAEGWGWAEAIHPDDRETLFEKWRSGLASGTRVDTEARIRRYDSAYRWFLIRGNPLRDERGDILKWYGTCVDIEDRKRGEEALLARELSWRQIVDSIPGFVATTTALGEVEFLNHQTLEYFGRTQEELKSWALIDAVHPDDLPRVIEERQKSILTGQIYEVEHRCRRADGVYRWFQVRGLPVRDAENKVTAWYLLLTDIDDRKRAEEALQSRELDARSLLDNMPGFLGRHSPDGTPEIVNRPFLEYYDKTLEEVQKWETSELVHPDDLAYVIGAFGKGISSGQPWSLELRLRRFDGIYRWFQARWVPVRDVEGRILHWNALTTDIDDRKQAEEALRTSERNLSLTINTIPALIHTARPDGYLDYFNRPWLDYLGCNLTDVEGWNWTSWIHPDDVTGIVDKWRTCLASGDIFEYEARVHHRDGQYRWMFHRKVPLRGEQGNIVRWYGTSIDIEDRKQAEEALRQSEERARLMVDSIDGQIMTATPKGEVEFVNQQVLDYFGKSLEELKDWRTNDAIHPEDFPRAATLWVHSVESGDPYAVDERLRRADGAYRWFRVRGRCVRDPEGQVVRWYVLLTDIDEGKRAEAQVEEAYLRLAEAQRISKTGSFITDLLANEHSWSEELYRIFEFDPATKITHEMIRAAFHPDDLPIYEAAFKRAVDGLEQDLEITYRIITPKGTVKHVHAVTRAMETAAGRSVFIGAIQDVTASKISEEALNRARAELAHMARVTTLSALTASIAHDVNQPIAAMTTSAGACLRWLNRDEPELQRAREAAMRIEEDGKRAADIIAHLRSFYRKDVSPQRQLIWINDLIGEMVVLLRSEAVRNSAVMSTELAPDLPAVSGDRVQLQQVLMNLMLNGIEAMREQGGELRISTRRQGEDVMASVSDTGHGLLTDNPEEIFNAFFTTKADGTGMGLAISRTIIESHGGRLWADQNARRGAAFHFTLPSHLKGLNVH